MEYIDYQVENRLIPIKSVHLERHPIVGRVIRRETSDGCRSGTDAGARHVGARGAARCLQREDDDGVGVDGRAGNGRRARGEGDGPGQGVRAAFDLKRVAGLL